MADQYDVSSSVLIDSSNSTLLSSEGSWEDQASSTETSDSDSIVFEDSVSMCSSNPIITQPSSRPNPIIATSQKNTPHSCESYSSDIDCVPESQDIDMPTPEYQIKNNVSNSVSDATLIDTKSCADALCFNERHRGHDTVLELSIMATLRLQGTPGISAICLHIIVTKIWVHLVYRTPHARWQSRAPHEPSQQDTVTNNPKQEKGVRRLGFTVAMPLQTTVTRIVPMTWTKGFDNTWDRLVNPWKTILWVQLKHLKRTYHGQQ